MQPAASGGVSCSPRSGGGAPNNAPNNPPTAAPRPPWLQVSIIYALPRLFVGSFTLVLPFFPTGTAERVRQPAPPPPPLPRAQHLPGTQPAQQKHEPHAQLPPVAHMGHPPHTQTLRCWRHRA